MNEELFSSLGDIFAAEQISLQAVKELFSVYRVMFENGGKTRKYQALTGILIVNVLRYVFGNAVDKTYLSAVSDEVQCYVCLKKEYPQFGRRG